MTATTTTASTTARRTAALYLQSVYCRAADLFPDLDAGGAEGMFATERPRTLAEKREQLSVLLSKLNHARLYLGLQGHGTRAVVRSHAQAEKLYRWVFAQAVEVASYGRIDAYQGLVVESVENA